MMNDLNRNKLINLLMEMFQNQGFDQGTIEYVDLIDDVGIDSIIFVSLIVEIEDRFNIIIPDDQLLIENFRNFDTIEKIIQQVL